MIGLQIDQGEVDGSTRGMPGMLGDITQPEQIGFAECRIVALPRRRFLAIARPRHHVGHRAGWTVAIQHFQRQFLRRQLLLDALQRQSDGTLHHAFARLVTSERPADEIIRAGVADVLDDGRIDVAQEHEVAGQALCGCRRSGGGYSDRDHNCFHEPSPQSSWPDLFRPSTSCSRKASKSKTWMPGTSPGMTAEKVVHERCLYPA